MFGGRRGSGTTNDSEGESTDHPGHEQEDSSSDEDENASGEDPLSLSGECAMAMSAALAHRIEESEADRAWEGAREQLPALACERARKADHERYQYDAEYFDEYDARWDARAHRERTPRGPQINAEP